MTRPVPHWITVLNGDFLGRRATRTAAMNLVDRPFRRGSAFVKNTSSGEYWQRRGVSWFRLDHDSVPVPPASTRAAALPPAEVQP